MGCVVFKRWELDWLCCKIPGRAGVEGNEMARGVLECFWNENKLLITLSKTTEWWLQTERGSNQSQSSAFYNKFNPNKTIDWLKPSTLFQCSLTLARIMGKWDQGETILFFATRINRHCYGTRRDSDSKLSQFLFKTFYNRSGDIKINLNRNMKLKQINSTK